MLYQGAWGPGVVEVQTILIGVMGTIYQRHTELTLSKLDLDRRRVKKLAQDPNTFQYATKIQIQEEGAFFILG